MLPPVISVLLAFVATWCRSSASLRLENMALRHQLAVYKHVSRPQLRPSDRLFWAWLSRLWSGWQHALAFVQPRTVIAWQQKRFRDHWRHLSQRARRAVPPSPKKSETSSRICGARIPCGDRLESWGNSVSWASTWPNPRWRSIVRASTSRHHPRGRPFSTIMSRTSSRVIFSLCPTATFHVLFVFIMLAHERRRIVHFNITEHPTAQWTAQQIVEAFPWETAPRYLLRDRDAIYSIAFQSRVKNLGIEEVKIAPRSPWQNPYCERLIGSIRRDVLDHVIVLNDRHLRRVLTAYISYYHRFRTHLVPRYGLPTTPRCRTA